MDAISLVVGLGNPGPEYARTRHNAGFMVVEQVAAGLSARWTFEKRFSAQVAKGDRDGQRLMLAEPQTYMNASGEAVAALLNFYRVPLARLLVVVDDADLPLGGLRMRPQGSSGGHHGLESIESHVGSREFARLRVGIGRRDEGRREITGHVLGKFGTAEMPLFEKVLERAAKQVACWWTDGVAAAMNRFNGVIDSEAKEA